MGAILTLIGILLVCGITGWATLLLLQHIADRRREQEMTFLQIIMPKKESKEDKEVESESFSTGKDFREVLGVMDHFYQALHSIYVSKVNRYVEGQPFLSIEYAALAGEILFFIVCQKKLAHLIEKHLTSFYPDAIIDEVQDYNIFTHESHAAAQVLVPKKEWSAAFKTYAQLKSDPLNNITNAFSKLKVDEGAAVQFVLKPERQGWQKKLQHEAENLINPKKKKGGRWWNPIMWLSTLWSVLTPGEEVDLKGPEMKGERVTQMAEEYSKALDEKANNPGFSTVIRIVTSAATPSRAHTLLETVISSFAQFNDTRGNSLHYLHHFVNENDTISRFIRRSPRRPLLHMLFTHKMLF